MIFTVLPARAAAPRKEGNRAYLLSDKWNDRYSWHTQYDLVFVTAELRILNIGSVKIGEVGMQPNSEAENRPGIPGRFEALSDRFFSVGQSERYYERLNELGTVLRDEILEGLRDLAWAPENLNKVLNEQVMKYSLLRDIPLQSLKGRFRRLAKGAKRSTPFKFSFRAPSLADTEQFGPSLTFHVIPDSEPPTNVHVLIGRNGVGKTFYLNTMTRVLISRPRKNVRPGVFTADLDNEDEGLFANVVSVAFSAFDAFETLPAPRSEVPGLQFSYIGLREINDERKWSGDLKGLSALTVEFLHSVRDLVDLDGGVDKWQRALKILESDPNFEDYNVSALASDVLSRNWLTKGRTLFNNLSSGHKVVLLTITRLVVDVTERTLVLIDEPESHLHPPLLSALIRSLSDLLIEQNGVALIATHSPVVLQEVPRSCVWKLRRKGEFVNAERPDIETFGENVGVLTREIFGLEATESGFHKMIEEVANETVSYEAALEHFSGQLGEEGRAILRAKLFASQQTPGGDW